jgi:hypothetical protein
MSSTDLAGVYRADLDCLNERRWDDLGGYVNDELSCNGEPMSLDDYRAARQFEPRAIPDLQFFRAHRRGRTPILYTFRDHEIAAVHSSSTRGPSPRRPRGEQRRASVGVAPW